VALDLTGMTKGLAWVNGRCLGRYWLARAAGERSPFLAGWIDKASIGRPSQTLYHVPREWLGEMNRLVLFDEVGGDPTQIRLCRA